MSSEIEEILDEADISYNSFKNFEVVSTVPFDHRFYTNGWPLMDRQFLCGTRRSKQEKEFRLKKRIEQEWEILEAKLPNSVYVRAYKTRRDLMRIVVIALEGSPYSYGLFFFDIFFPYDYPSKPPLIFHHPNKHPSSVQNTSFWYNFKSDTCNVFYDTVRSTWDPKTSNVYSMLGVIQGNVLMQPRVYSKDVDKEFMLSHTAMLSCLSSPPRGFEVFVEGHFRMYSHYILLKFKGKKSSDDKKEISRTFLDLYKAFKKNGSYCKQFKPLKNVLKKELKDASSTSSVMSAQENTGSGKFEENRPLSEVSRWFRKTI